MRDVRAYRASCILYNFLLSNPIRRVLCPANICPDVLDTIRMAGKETVFADIDAETLCIAPHTAEAAQAECLLFVRTYGSLQAPLPGGFPFVIDDRCLCPPEEAAGAGANLTLYSTGERKYAELGSGGYAFIGGQAAYAEHPVPRNSFLEGDTPSWTWQDILSKRAEVWGHKQRLNEIYRTSLPAGIQLPEHFQQWRFHIRMENPAPVVAALFAAPGRLFAAPGRLFAGRHYASRALPGTCPCAEDLAAHVINLFNDLYYSEEQAYRTCEIIRRFLA